MFKVFEMTDFCIRSSTLPVLLLLLVNVSIDNEYEYENEISDFAYCASLLRIITFSSRPVKLHYDEFSPKTRSGQNEWEEPDFKGKFRSFNAVFFSFLASLYHLEHSLYYVLCKMLLLKSNKPTERDISYTE